jgi:peptide/nickel transport system substrate-binding protein
VVQIRRNDCSNKRSGRMPVAAIKGGTAALVAALMLSACSPASGPTPEGGGGGDAASSITFLSAENLAGRWDPFDHTLLSQDRLQQAAYEGLLTLDENLEYQPALATEWSNPSPEIWEFKLREGVTFHDGTPFTAADVKASIEYVSSPEVTGSFAYPNPFTVEVIDDHTVRVNTGAPFAATLALFASGVSAVIAPAHLIESGGLDEKFVGTGPYMWDSYDGEDAGVKLTAFPDYWGEQPKTKDYIFRYVGDSQTRLAALQSGQAQIIDRVEPDQIAVIEADPNLAVQRTPTVESKWTAFRIEKAPMDNVKLRQAIAHAIDVPTIVENIMMGSGEVNTSFLTSMQEFSEDSPTYPKFDKEKAKALLAEAGYPNGEGLRELEYCVSVGFYPKTKEYGEFIIQNLSDIGIKARLQTLEVARYNQMLFDPMACDLYDHGWFIASKDPEVMLLSLFRNALVTGKPIPAVATVLEKESAAMNPEERAELFRTEVLPTIETELPEYPMFASELATGYSASLQGLEVWPNSYFRIQDVSVG